MKRRVVYITAAPGSDLYDLEVVDFGAGGTGWVVPEKGGEQLPLDAILDAAKSAMTEYAS